MVKLNHICKLYLNVAISEKLNTAEEEWRMLKESTIYKPYVLHLKTIAKGFKEQMSDTSITALSFEERFGLLIDS